MPTFSTGLRRHARLDSLPGQSETSTTAQPTTEVHVSQDAQTPAGPTDGQVDSAVVAPLVEPKTIARTERRLPVEPDPVMGCDNVTVYYGAFRAVTRVSMGFGRNEITALIGPSGCGKSTLLRSLNRMNDLVDGARVEGFVTYHGTNIYGRDVDPIEVRRRVGMVFQKPNPFPKSIYDNIAYGPRATGMKVADMDVLVEECLTRAALWDEVKDKLKQSAYGLSGGQQQRLCIARTLAVKPDVILMDEPCSALDPIATARIEDLMVELRDDYTIIIVTHNMQQAARVADRTAFFTALADETTGNRTGLLVEYDQTKNLFRNPRDKRTEDYISGRFG
jgi:phosphate ABC transporter ATP-binding protein